MRADFERDGFVIVPGALRPAQVLRLEDAVDRVWEAEARSVGPFHRLAFVGLDDAFVELVDHPRCLPLVSDVLGDNIYVYHCHLDVHPPQRDFERRWRWHQDGSRQNVELESPRPRLSVKVAYFLTDVPSAEYGALRVVPGSHGRDTLPRDREPVDAIPLLVEAGSAVTSIGGSGTRVGTISPAGRGRSCSTATPIAGSGLVTSWRSTRNA